MQITNLKTYPLCLPMKKAVTMAHDVVKEAETLIIKLETDEGITGFGETAAALKFAGETLISMKYVLDRHVRPALLGEDPFDIEKIHLILDKIMTHNNGARAAIDIALHDVVCRALGIPLYKLLGGRTREDVRLTWHVANANYEKDIEEASQAWDLGFEVIKLKVGTSDIQQELRTIEAIRKKLGNVDLRLDANQGFTTPTAITYIKQTEPFNISFFEQPIYHRHLAGMAKICASVNVPIAADEGISTAEDVVMNYETRSADIIGLKLMKAGGIAGIMKAAHICQAFGFPVHLSAKIAETSIATSAAIHLGVSLPKLEYDCGTTNHYLLDDIVVEPLVPINGRLKPFEKPGLGVEVDEEKLKKYELSS
jgi:o-succinylbenzoate synthase